MPNAVVAVEESVAWLGAISGAAVALVVLTVWRLHVRVARRAARVVWQDDLIVALARAELLMERAAGVATAPPAVSRRIGADLRSVRREVRELARTAPNGHAAFALRPIVDVLGELARSVESVVDAAPVDQADLGRSTGATCVALARAINRVLPRT